MLIRNLASGETGTWRIVYLPDERHLYVGFWHRGRRRPSTIDDEFTMEDFLEVYPPESELHQQALERLVVMVVRMLRERE